MCSGGSTTEGDVSWNVFCGDVVTDGWSVHLSLPTSAARKIGTVFVARVASVSSALRVQFAFCILQPRSFSECSFTERDIVWILCFRDVTDGLALGQLTDVSS